MGYQSDRKLLEKFREEGIPINWTVIFLGLHGIGKYEMLISVNELIEYAITQLEENPNQSEEVVFLAGLHQNDNHEAKKYVKILSNREKTDIEVEKKKWILILLKDLLGKVNSDPIYGIIQLTEFWEKFDYPDFSPHIVQGVMNNIDPKRYYTENNFKKILQLHEAWIQKELLSVVACRSPRIKSSEKSED
jgi:hypothetical protein